MNDKKIAGIAGLLVTERQDKQTRKGHASIKRFSKAFGLTSDEHKTLMAIMDYPTDKWEPKR